MWVHCLLLVNLVLVLKVNGFLGGVINVLRMCRGRLCLLYLLNICFLRFTISVNVNRVNIIMLLLLVLCAGVVMRLIVRLKMEFLIRN